MTCDPAHGQAMVLAWSALDGVDGRELARASGGTLEGSELGLPCFGFEIVLDLRDRSVLTPVELGGCWGLIALHHVKGCLGWRRDDEWIGMEQVPDARPFAPAFRQRALLPLAGRFGDQPAGLIASGRRLGGRRMGMGDAALLFQPFPRLRVAVVIWRGDGEIPGGANLLFDRGGAATLPAEDLAELGISLSQMLVSKDQ